MVSYSCSFVLILIRLPNMQTRAYGEQDGLFGVARHAEAAVSQVTELAGTRKHKLNTRSFRGNHLSNATCLTQDFFKRGE